ncbi:helix-turn-helix domain-containing protein [Pseudalkalibacillus sp. A8]|uniref:helix-turn-helix domain-containing protein n=1 Tax=Pseudalkalibacillus sp. A8 TaxID=3382641 RepID=UPI0038B5094A
MKIVEWLRIHTTDNISVTSVAEQFNYNKDYLSHIFKQKIGINIQEYIHILKVSKAKDLLSSTNLGIKEIAYTIGISDEKYFMKLFKKYEKLTPTEFRKAYYRTHLNKE